MSGCSKGCLLPKGQGTGSQGDPGAASTLSSTGTVSQGLTTLSRAGSCNGVCRQPQAGQAMHQGQGTSSGWTGGQRRRWGHDYKRAPEVCQGLLVSGLGVRIDSPGGAEMVSWAMGRTGGRPQRRLGRVSGLRALTSRINHT